MARLVPDSTPGIPAFRLGATNALVLESHRDFLLASVVARLARCIELGEDIFSMSPSDLVKEGVRCPVRLFVKDEPHSLKKVREGKFRLISGVSVLDQLFERILGSTQNCAEIADWASCPSKPGIGLDDDGLRTMSSTFSSMLSRGVLSGMDVSGWDWSVQEWELNADAECRRRLSGAEENSLFSFLLRVQAYAISRSVFVLPDGSMVAQGLPGIQLSGSYWTSSTNSRMRVLATCVARQKAGYQLEGPLDIVAMGDDSVERLLEGVKEELEKLGHGIKVVDVYRSLENISFCSHVWNSEGLASPEDPSKTLFRFFSHPPSSASYLDWYVQLSWVLRHFKEKDSFLGVAFARAGRANEFCGESPAPETSSS